MNSVFVRSLLLQIQCVAHSNQSVRIEQAAADRAQVPQLRQRPARQTMPHNAWPKQGSANHPLFLDNALSALVDKFVRRFCEITEGWLVGWLGGSSPDFHTPTRFIFKWLNINDLVLSAEVKLHTCMHAGRQA